MMLTVKKGIIVNKFISIKTLENRVNKFKKIHKVEPAFIVVKDWLKFHKTIWSGREPFNWSNPTLEKYGFVEKKSNLDCSVTFNGIDVYVGF